MRNVECVADIDLHGHNLPDLYSDTTIKNSITVLVQYCQKRKCDFNEIKQNDVAVYNN